MFEVNKDFNKSNTINEFILKLKQQIRFHHNPDFGYKKVRVYNQSLDAENEFFMK